MNFLFRALLVAFLVLAFAIPALADDGSSWADRITFKGDARLRHESIDEDGLHVLLVDVDYDGADGLAASADGGR